MGHRRGGVATAPAILGGSLLLDLPKDTEQVGPAWTTP